LPNKVVNALFVLASLAPFSYTSFAATKSPAKGPGMKDPAMSFNEVF
jgi:hypothetical protein